MRTCVAGQTFVNQVVRCARYALRIELGAYCGAAFEAKAQHNIIAAQITQRQVTRFGIKFVLFTDTLLLFAL